MVELNKIMRTLRVRNDQALGTLGRLLTAVAETGGDVGEIRLVQETHQSVIRDISIYFDDEAQLLQVLDSVRNNPGTRLLAVRDEVLELHQSGKIIVRSRIPIDSLTTLRRVYTPGVAEVCRRIAEDPSLARQYTAIGGLIAIVTDGSAVLGLGNIGPVAGMPVMEGKAMLLSSLVGLSAIPILLDTQVVDEIIDTVVHIAPTFAAIQLEDISAPRCFEIEQRLMERLEMPVMHDDQHGTAVVAVAALKSVCRMTGADLMTARIGQVGLGAAGYAIGRMLMKMTGNPVMGADLSTEALHRFAELGGRQCSLSEMMASSDIVIATTGVPNLIRPEMVRPGQVILALSNPVPEIDPEAAMAAGAVFAADGKMVNNLLGFPGIFRGAVDAQVRRISREMLLAASDAIVAQAHAGELLPNPLDPSVHQAVAKAVARKAVEQGLSQADYVPYTED